METATVILDETDAQTVAAVKSGNYERYRELIERHERRVFAVAWSRLGDPDLAEEATQEAFIRGYRHLAFLSHGGRFAAWITAIARNTAINLGLRHRHELKKRERWALENPRLPEAAEPGSELSQEPVSAETLRTTLAELPDHHRECLTLFYLEGRSIADAAEALGLTETAFKTRLHRARNALRERLEGALEESLKKLGPRRALAPAIMAWLVASQAEVAAAGIGSGSVFLKVGAGLAKVLPFHFIMTSIWCLSQIPGLLLAYWLGRLDQRNFRDPQGFRAQLHQEALKRMLVMFPILMLIIFLGIHWLVQATGWEGYGRAFGLLFLFILAQQARLLVLNRSRFVVGQFLATLFMVLGWIGLGFLGFPPSAFGFFFAAFLLMTTWTMRYRPQRMDYSLFLRVAQGTIPSEAGSQTCLASFSMPSNRQSEVHPRLAKPLRGLEAGKLTSDELLRFARFLCERWLVCDYRRMAEGLRLRLTAVKPSRFTDMLLMLWGQSSTLTIGSDGPVKATLGEKDAKQLGEMDGRMITQSEGLESGVAEAVQTSLQHFLEGNLHQAEQALGEQQTDAIFVDPPERSQGTRWRGRIMVACAIIWMLLALITWWTDQKKRTTPPSNMKPVSLTASEVRSTLARLGQDRDTDPAAWREWEENTYLPFSLPPKNLFTPPAWQNLRDNLLSPATTNPEFSSQDRQRWHRALLNPGSTLAKAVLSGTITPADLAEFGITKDSVREYLLWLPQRELDELTRLREIGVRAREYTALRVYELSGTLRMLALFDCLDLVEATPIIAELCAHQVREGNVLEGRMPLVDRREVHGLFHCVNEPLRDTYHALNILSLLGGLDQMDQAACREGLLRLHRGKGYFRLENHRNPGLVIFGDARDTAYAFESLRILNALDCVKDLAKWVFVSPEFKPEPTSDGPRLVNSENIEAWLYQQRLQAFLKNHQQDPGRPIPSLFDPAQNHLTSEVLGEQKTF